KDSHRGSGRMDATLLLGCWHALYAVDPRLEFQETVSTFAFHAADDFFVSAGCTFSKVEDRELEAPLIAKALIHAEQVAGENGGLVTTRSRANLKYCPLVVIRILRHEHFLEFARKLVDLRFELVQFCFCEFAHFRILLFFQHFP